ncbi:MAG: N-acetyltransferase [Betaproteobacteria bacterium]|nr:N-acetyltransferase [Betaproteobacteria bacterium]
MPLEVLDSLAGVDPAQWNALAGASPPLQHAFLHALHESGAASPATGWVPRYLVARREGQLVGAVPAYEKHHSWGEFVFDWAWADAYRRQGQAYYPKLVVAVPFTPVPGPRILARDPAVRQALVDGLESLRARLDASSVHVLFPPEDDAALLQEAGYGLREGVQFHWHNAGYPDFEAFLASLNHDKRKKIRQERRRVREAGITFEWRTGADIRERDWHFFERCYHATYRQHGATPYLNLDFFLRIGRTMGQQLCLILACREGEPIASALNLWNAQRACGRYWGALEYVPGLHFETCYYQSIAFCIAHGIRVFEGGAQGEHKLARGLMPVRTVSLHRMADARFDQAVSGFLRREALGIEHYRQELEEHGPFRKATE